MLLENPRRHDRRSLDLAFGEHENVSLDIPANAQAIVAIPCLAPTRGRLDPGRITLSTCYPLGLFHAWSYPHPRLSCLVFPKPIESPLPPPSAVAHTGQRAWRQRRRGLHRAAPAPAERFTTPHCLEGCRSRHRHIARLLIKQFAGGSPTKNSGSTLESTDARPTRRSRHAIVDPRRPGCSPPNRQHIHYGLRLPGREIEAEPVRDAHRHACLEALALAWLNRAPEPSLHRCSIRARISVAIGRRCRNCSPAHQPTSRSG